MTHRSHLRPDAVVEPLLIKIHRQTCSNWIIQLEETLRQYGAPVQPHQAR